MPSSGTNLNFYRSGTGDVNISTQVLTLPTYFSANAWTDSGDCKSTASNSINCFAAYVDTSSIDSSLASIMAFIAASWVDTALSSDALSAFSVSFSF